MDDEPGLCLYGCATTSFLIARSELALLATGSTELSAEEIESMVKFIFFHIGGGKVFFGHDSALDLVSASSWPVASHDLERLLRKAQGLASGHPEEFKLPRPGALDLALHWYPCDSVMHEGCFLPASVARGRVRREGVSGKPLAMLFVGEHAPFINNVWQCLTSAAMSLGTSLRPIFAGSFYGCRGLPSGCEPEPVKDWMHAWMDRFPLDGETALQPDHIEREADGLMNALQSHPDPFATSPDLLFCGEIVLFCWLLRRKSLLAKAAGFQRLPTLHNYGMVFLQYVPQTWQSEMMQDFSQWWIWQRDAAREPAAVNIEILGMQLQWQMGIAVPWVPSMGTSDTAGVLYSPPRSGKVRTALVLKSGFFKRAQGQIFDTVLRRLAADMTGQVLLHHWATDPASEFLGFEDMASYSCALYVAPEFSQMIFRDMYGAGVPILAPDMDWHLRLLRHMFASWGQMHSEHDIGRLPPVGSKEGCSERVEASRAIASVADSWPFPPFYEPRRNSPEHLAFWLPLGEVYRFPHVLFFSSLVSFLKLVAEADLVAQSSKVQEHGRRITANVHRFYRESLRQLVFPTENTE